jgi:hypothetical protein
MKKFVFMFLLALTAFVSLSAHSYEGQRCRRQWDCSYYGESCVNNRCTSYGNPGHPYPPPRYSCNFDFHCPAGMACDQWRNECVPRRTGPGDQCDAFNPCSRGYECRGGRCYRYGDRCLPSGASCGSASSGRDRCCSRECVQVPGDNNNYCR